MCAVCMCMCVHECIVCRVCVYTQMPCVPCVCVQMPWCTWGGQRVVFRNWFSPLTMWVSGGIKLKWLKLSGGAFTNRAISLAHNLFSGLLIYIAKGAKKKKRPWQSHKCALPSFRDRANPRSDEGHPAPSQWPNIAAVIRQVSTQGPRGVCDGRLSL